MFIKTKLKYAILKRKLCPEIPYWELKIPLQEEQFSSLGLDLSVSKPHVLLSLKVYSVPCKP